ncbi:MAG: hypothetical protein QOI24_4660 [Acidobacteriota bacterium]|jgi:hypothetical protein|nr:hypothetical protein [Acidobacteriota bacterium]
MSRVIRSLLAVALFAFATIAEASSLQLVAPANNTTLRGGSFAELRWSATQLPPHTEEWEAFLSIDGGRYYAFRVTPHLDIKLRRFTFAVPNVSTHDARILIRTGDEEQETHFEPPGSFSIERDPNAEVVVPRLLQLRRGEAARDGDPDVLSWADGARSGFGVTQQSSATKRSTSIDLATTIATDSDPVLAPAVNEVAAPAIAQTQRTSNSVRARKTEPLPISVDLLLVCRRRNI